MLCCVAACIGCWVLLALRRFGPFIASVVFRLFCRLQGYPGRTHRFWSGPPPVYNFGAGLSYSTLGYRWAPPPAPRATLISRRAVRNLLKAWFPPSLPL